MVIKQQKVRV